MTIRPKTTLHEVTGEEVECWVADGLEDALLGYGEQGMHTVAVYDYDKCIEIFMTREGGTQEEAVDHMSYNVTGTSFESKTPVFVEMHWDNLACEEGLQRGDAMVTPTKFATQQHAKRPAGWA